MLERLLRLAALVASLLVVGGWALFAIDETSAASHLSAAVREPDPTPRQERAREEVHGDARELIDDANDILLAPFAPIVTSVDSEWVRRTVPALLGLVVYGFGLGFLARLARGVV